MDQITDHARQEVDAIARRNDTSTDAVMTLLHALQRGHGTAAQFDCKELGGMGQWSQGGMTQVGDMFNTALKAKVNAICTDLANLLQQRDVFAQANEPQNHTPTGASGGPSGGSDWWPGDLGRPSSSGGQNDMRYALFPGKHRLAVQVGGKVTVYDSGDHRITGFAQQQGGGSQTLRFTSQDGTVSTDDLKTVG